MSKCDLSVELEEPSRTFRPGEAIRGHVLVRTREVVPCKNVTVRLQWRTHGRGNVRSGPDRGFVLHEGPLPAGEDRSYPFEFQAPHGPATYHGQILNVDHYVITRADVPWAIDPKGEAEVLIPAERGSGYDHGPAHKPGPPDIKGEGAAAAVFSIVIGAAFGIPGLTILLGGAGFAVAALVRGRMEYAFPAVFMIPFGAVFAAVGFGVALLLQRRNLAQRKLGRPVVRVHPDTASPGGRVSVHVTVTPRSDVTLTSAVVVFQGRERVVSGSGTNSTTHTHVFHTEEAGLDLPEQLRARSSVDRTLSFDIPANAAPTFQATDNDLLWIAVVKIGLAGWPDWELEYPITVTP